LGGGGENKRHKKRSPRSGGRGKERASQREKKRELEKEKSRAVASSWKEGGTAKGRGERLGKE